MDFEIEAEISLGFALKRQKIAGHKPFLHRINGETEGFQCGSAQNGLFARLGKRHGNRERPAINREQRATYISLDSATIC